MMPGRIANRLGKSDFGRQLAVDSSLLAPMFPFFRRAIGAVPFKGDRCVEQLSDDISGRGKLFSAYSAQPNTYPMEDYVSKFYDIEALLDFRLFFLTLAVA